MILEAVLAIFVGCIIGFIISKILVNLEKKKIKDAMINSILQKKYKFTYQGETVDVEDYIKHGLKEIPKKTRKKAPTEDEKKIVPNKLKKKPSKKKTKKKK